MIRILIADDHELFNDGLKHMLKDEYPEIVQVFHGKSVLHEIQQKTPHLVILDINLPGSNGIDLGKIIRKDFPEIHLIFLSMYREPAFIKAAEELGARGYLFKDSGRLEILADIKRVLAKETVFVYNESGNLHAEDYFVKNFSLSKREVEVIRLIRQGLSSEKIAETLCLSYETVKSHRKNIFFKLKINKVTDLITFSINHGI